jgi:NADPH:quinone reductase
VSCKQNSKSTQSQLKKNHTMNAIEITQYGAPEVLALCQRPMPTAAAGEVLIKVAASGVNRPDVLQRKGFYPVPPGASDLPGLEVAGTIEAGDAATLAQYGLQLGQAVCALVTGGGYAQYCTAPAAQCLPVPAGLSMVEAASLPETFFTVYSNVVTRGGLQAGETILIHGGSSGIGVAAIQIAKALGATVITTVGSADKMAACLALGADHIINYKIQDFLNEVKILTQGKGADVVLCMVAGSYLERNVHALADDGRLVIIATQGGNAGELDLMQLMRRRLTVTGSTLRPRPIAFKAAVAQDLKRVIWPFLESGRIKPVIHTVLPANEASSAAAAHRLMESSTHVGKIVLQW